MSTQNVSKPQIPPAIVAGAAAVAKAPAIIKPVKIGIMGEQGVGKTTSAGLIAAAISKLYHNGAPVHVTDAELGWEFLEPVIFGPEKIQLVTRTIPTFKAMLNDIDFAEREGACVWGVELGKIWIEIVRTLQAKDPINWGMQLRSMWDDFVARFLNSKMHCLVLGRIQDVVEDVIVSDKGDVRSIKVGEGMKAGGQKNNFGYEPHLVIRMHLEAKQRTRKGKIFEDEGRMIHRAHITKDRTWATNGRVFRWQDRDGYRPGDFKYVWKDIKPHFDAVQAAKRGTLDASASSMSMIDSNGNGEYYRNRERKDAILAEIKGCLDLYFAGRGAADVQIRLAVSDLVFGVKTGAGAEMLTLDQLERGFRILQAYQRLNQHDLNSKESVLGEMAKVIQAFDRCEIENIPEDIPF